MQNHYLALVCGVALLLGLAGPALGAAAPSWIAEGTAGGELSGVVISADDSTIVSGGDQLICLTREGQKRWSGWSGTSLDISHDGDYILASKGQAVRLISSAGNLVWERSIEIPVTDVSLAQNLSFIAAAGGGKLRTITLTGESIASNDTISVNDIRILPPGEGIIVATNRNLQFLSTRLVPSWSDTNATQNLIAVAPDGSSFVTATFNRVRMYTGNGTMVWDKRIPHGNAQALAYSGDGSTIVVGMDDNFVHVMNRNSAQLWSANATNWISAVAVSNDGNTIAAGSLDKKVYVFNHAGSRLGIFNAKSAIKFNSVAVTGDGLLVVVVDESAVYGLRRSAFTEEITPQKTVTGSVSETPGEIVTTPLPATTTRKVTLRTATIPTPYPPESQTPEAALPPSVPVIGLLLLLFCRPGRH